MRLFSSTYQSKVKGEGKKAQNSGRARRYAYARNAKKTFVYAFLDKYGGNKGAHLCLSHRTDKETGGRSAQKRHIGKRASHFPMCSFAKGKGEERELKPKGISGVF